MIPQFRKCSTVGGTLAAINFGKSLRSHADSNISYMQSPLVTVVSTSCESAIDNKCNQEEEEHKEPSSALKGTLHDLLEASED